MTQINFNAFDFDPTQGGSFCFPLADYKLEITGAAPMLVKDNPNAGYLELSLTVLEGECRGLVQKDRLNIFHTSEVAKRIAHQTLAAYCFAINRPYVQDTDQLIGGRLIGTIGPQDDNPKYSEVKVVKCMDGTLPTRPAQQAQAAQTGPPAPPPAPTQTANAQPWAGIPQQASAPSQPPPNPPVWAPPVPPTSGPQPNAQTAPPWNPPNSGTAMPPWATASK